MTTLGQELEALEAETFEIAEYADTDERMANGCSTTSSSSCSSTTSSCSSTSSG